LGESPRLAVGLGQLYPPPEAVAARRKGTSVTPSRIRSRRLGAILATALFTVALVPGLATAADTRLMSITMTTPTRVSVPAEGKGPYGTTFEVDIANTGGQNLAHTVLTIKGNGTGMGVVAISDTDGGTDATFCTSSGATITCDYSSLGPGQTRTIAVVYSISSDYTPPTVTDPPTPVFTASVTTNNENGSNQQTFPVGSGTFVVEPTGDNTLATFELAGSSEDLATAGVDASKSNKLSTNVKFNTANKELIQINEDDSTTTGFYACPTGLSCQNDYSEVTTSTETFSTAPFLTWKLTALVPKTYSLSQGFVAHFLSRSSTYDWILYFKDKSAMCPSSATALATKITTDHHCISGLSLTKFDKTFNQLLVTVVMDHQGGLKY